MAKKKIQALVAKLAAHDIFGQFRFIKKEDGEIWFVGIDVAKILGYKNGSRDIYRHVDAEDREVIRLSTETVPNLGGNPNKIIINESGLYSLILGSQLPEAKKFTRWVTSEVLPSIRKTGEYKIPQQENLLDDWEADSMTYEEFEAVVETLERKGTKYDFALTDVDYYYNEKLGKMAPILHIKLKIDD